MKIALFFTRGVSLSTWDSIGSLEREVAIYRCLLEFGHEIVFVTYGNRVDLQFERQLDGIRVACNWLNLPASLYERLLPFIHARQLRRCDVFKTNQTQGGDMARRCALWFRKRLVARCGYMLSFNEGQEKGAQAQQKAEEQEGRLFCAADRIVVTTDVMRENVKMRHPELAPRVSVIPNYVETDRFVPRGAESITDVIYVGRLSAEKNLAALLDAVRRIGCSIAIAGTGELGRSLEESCRDLGDRVKWHGNIPHHDLPRFLATGRVFALPSHYEGHPKALIEAMACGCAIVATDVPGIRELVRHREDGWLCKTDSDSIRSALDSLLSDPSLRQRLGEAARIRALNDFSLDRIAHLEQSLLQSLVTTHD